MFWTQGAKVPQESFAPPKPLFCTGAQPEIADRWRSSIARLNRNATLLSLVSEIAAISGLRDGHRNRKNRKNRCDAVRLFPPSASQPIVATSAPDLGQFAEPRLAYPPSYRGCVAGVLSPVV